MKAFYRDGKRTIARGEVGAPRNAIVLGGCLSRELSRPAANCNRSWRILARKGEAAVVSPARSWHVLRRWSMFEHLFIAGASARAAAQSAVRAGFHVTAVDLFCDRDLAACCRAFHVQDFPRGILSVAERIAPMEWLYTGGLENEPALVDAVSRRHRLLGHAGAVLRQICDPWHLGDVLARAGLRFPYPEHRPPRGAAGRWLLKPLRSCGGTRIRVCDPRRVMEPLTEMDSPVSEVDAGQHAGRTYFQPWIRGPSYGAVFLAAHGAAELLGVTRQLVGCSWAGASGFRYAGSIGPVAFDSGTYREVQRIGNCLAAAFPLCGLFGIDMIVAGPDVWTIEVNPRYTASVEVLERMGGLVALGLHQEVCHGAPLPRVTPLIADRLYGKAVVFARADHTIGDAFYRRLDAIRSCTGDCEFADLPQVGTTIRAGKPVLTTLTQGRDVREVHHRLRAIARMIHALLAEFPSGDV
jgi:predicted ATP-grasp superfamily ATP-dependent carboligase